MTDAMTHRGPDGRGLYQDPDRPVFLGHRRLAIIDLEDGAQPMWSGDGQIGVVFNGEIYNHQSLRAELLAEGHVFATDHSDTEVLINGYRAWGRELPKRLNGMFAFCVFDRAAGTLFLARDRFGEKPLFYAADSGFFGFASELTALAEHPNIDRTPCPTALRKFFAHGFIPGANAFLKGTQKLRPGHRLTLTMASGAIEVDSYWRFTLDPDPDLERADENTVAEMLEALLATSVERRMMSDRSLGVFLSGGIDSSTAVAFADRYRGAEPLKTFTIGFSEKSYDESAWAAQVAAQFGTDHRCEILDLDSFIAAFLPTLGKLDEPLADASILPSARLCAFAKQQVTVALSGDGGDELFAGYAPFKALKPTGIYDRLVPAPVHGFLRGLADRMPVSDGYMSLDFKVKRTLMGLSYPANVRNAVWMSPLRPDLMAEVFGEPVRLDDLYAEVLEVWESSKTGHPMDRTLEYFTHFYLPDDILTKMDRASMWASLESRSIFLDNDLAEFCMALPRKFKFHGGTGKRVLKRALRGLIDDRILDRKKRGFAIPLTSWLRDPRLASPERPIAGMSRPAISRLWDEHLTRKADHRLALLADLAVQSSPFVSKGASDGP